MPRADRARIIAEQQRLQATRTKVAIWKRKVANLKRKITTLQKEVRKLNAKKTLASKKAMKAVVASVTRQFQNKVKQHFPDVLDDKIRTYVKMGNKVKKESRR